MTLASSVFARVAKLPAATVKTVTVDKGLRVPGPDGTSFVADRYVPAGRERAPILLMRTPYGRQGVSAILGRVLAERGYQVVLVSCRGTFGSTGQWTPFRDEKADGAAVLAWLEQQPWFVPNVGLFGPSYVGLTQWAVMADLPEWVKLTSLDVTCSWFREIVYPGEAFGLETALSWIHAIARQELPLRQKLAGMATQKKTVAAAANVLPLNRADTAATGGPVAFYQDWLRHPEPGDPWWEPVDFSDGIAVAPPSALVAGWYDLFCGYQLENYKALVAAGRTARLTVGPWWHGSPQGAFGWLRDLLDWADAHLGGGTISRAPVSVFDLGTKRWRDLPAWPPEAGTLRLHLQPGGRLDAAAAGDAAPSRWRYDPADPTPNVGGASLASSSGGHDQAKTEARQDVLTFTTAPMTTDLQVAGELSADLFVGSSVEHFDVFTRLCLVDPKGKSVNLTDGLVRLSGVTGEQRVTVRLFPTVCTVPRGHALRLQVSSGAHPLYARNTGTGEPLGTASRLVAADQQLWHDADHPSALVLPVLA